MVELVERNEIGVRRWAKCPISRAPCFRRACIAAPCERAAEMESQAPSVSLPAGCAGATERVVLLHRHDAARNMHRFYVLRLSRDLFCDWVLLREWGRIGAAGQVRTDRFGSEAEAMAALDRLVRSKRRSGYIEPRGHL